MTPGGCWNEDHPIRPRGSRRCCSSCWAAADPLNDCTSLDTPIGPEDGGSVLGDLQEDPGAAQAFQAAEEEIYTQELHAALEEALGKLADREADVIRRHYYKGQSLREIGEEIGLSGNRVNQMEQHGLQRMKALPGLRRWRDEIITTRAWRGTGFGAWKHSGSVQERTVEYLE